MKTLLEKLKGRLSLKLFILGMAMAGTLALWFISEKISQKITIYNSSGLNIESMEIHYSNKKLTLNNIDAYSTLTKKINANSDGSFYIKVYFEDGIFLEKKDLGYITNADSSKTIITIINKSELKFEQSY